MKHTIEALKPLCCIQSVVFISLLTFPILSVAEQNLSYLNDAIRIDNGIIEFSVEDVPAQDIVEVLGRKVGFDVKLEGALSDVRVSGEYSEKSVEAVLRQLKLQHVLVWTPASAGNDGEKKIKEIVLLSTGTEQSGFLNDGLVEPVESKTIRRAVENSLLSPSADSETDVEQGNDNAVTSKGFNFSFDPGKAIDQN